MIDRTSVLPGDTFFLIPHRIKCAFDATWLWNCRRSLSIIHYPLFGRKGDIRCSKIKFVALSVMNLGRTKVMAAQLLSVIDTKIFISLQTEFCYFCVQTTEVIKLNCRIFFSLKIIRQCVQPAGGPCHAHASPSHRRTVLLYCCTGIPLPPPSHH